jgi:hypothetical protein
MRRSEITTSKVRGGAELHAGERGRAVDLGVDLVALLAQQRPEDLAQVGFVVDEEDAMAGSLGHWLRGWRWCGGWGSIGRTTVNWAPPPSGALASMRPR